MRKRKTEVIESFGRRLAQLRKDAGFTQVELATVVDITHGWWPTTVSYTHLTLPTSDLV